MREDDIFKRIPPVIAPTEDQIVRARTVVCANAADAREAESMLKMLDLL